MTHRTGLPLLVNPAVRPGLDALDWHLADNHYSQHARESIVAFAAAEGTPTGCPDLEPEDEAGATEAFVSALPAVPSDDAAWDDQTMCLDAEWLAAGNHPWPIPTEPESPDDRIGPDDADRSIPADAVLVPPELLELAPICGGSPGPYEPTEADWEDYRAWAEEIERRAREARMTDVRYGYE